MTHMSATQIINQLNNSNKLPDFQKQNSLIYRQPKFTYQRKLSPWLPKRRLSKSIKNSNKVNDEQKTMQSEKTEQFLRKIFTNKIEKKSADSKNVSELNQTKYKSGQKKKQQEQQTSYIFLPINLINFKKNPQKKQLSLPKQKKNEKTQKPQLNKTFMHTVEPKMEIKINQHYSHRNNQTPKMSPMVLTFRRSWRKKEKCKTQPCQNFNQKRNITIDQVYNLLGKKQTKKYSYSFNSNIIENIISQQINQQQIRKDTQWLVPRQFINRKNKRIRTIPFKTQAF